jgi:hypothetical protein
MLVMKFRKAQSRKRKLKLAMAAGVSRNDANKVLWMKKTINQCFERHNREAELKDLRAQLADLMAG